jgi:hypothetical protein
MPIDYVICNMLCMLDGIITIVVATLLLIFGFKVLDK